MSGDGSFEWVDYNAKVEVPDGVVVNVKKRYDGNDSHFVGWRAGVSGDITLLKAETKLSDNVSVGLQGPSAGASLGARFGTETNVAAIVEPSLVKAEGKLGPVVGSVGLNATTGVKVSGEGVKVGFLGFGLTAGVGGKFTLDTPFGSAGFATETHKQTHKNENVQYN